MKLAAIQPFVTADKERNIETALRLIAESACGGAQMAVLPEMFFCPIDFDLFPKYAEPAGGAAWQAMSDAAKQNGLWLVAGSMPETGEGGEIYNSCFVFAPDGSCAARHRKMHLYDVDIEGGTHFMESESVTPGSDVTVFDTPFGRFGVVVCFDIRYPELFRLTVDAGAEAIIIPAVFNMSTGPLHWELTCRARAVDNQVYTVGCAPARNEALSYVPYANSLVCSPWGEVTARLGTEEGILFTDIDFSEVQKVREQLPLLKLCRQDVYTLRRSSN